MRYLLFYQMVLAVSFDLSVGHDYVEDGQIDMTFITKRRKNFV